MAQQRKQDKYKDDRGGPCDLACLRGLLIAFNFVFILGGGGALAIGIWTIIMKMQYVAVLTTMWYNLVVYLLMGGGVLVLLTGIIGCVGAIQKNQGMLTCYFVLLVIIFLCECLSGIFAFIYYQNIHEELENNMRSNLNKNYNQTGYESLTIAMDEMQQDFMCCGVASYADWQDSKYIKQNKDDLKTPESCCKTPSPLCSQRDHPSNIYRILGSESMGCLTKLELYLKEHLFVLAITGTVVACIEILVMIFACYLRGSIKDEDNQPY